MQKQVSGYTAIAQGYGSESKSLRTVLKTNLMTKRVVPWVVTLVIAACIATPSIEAEPFQVSKTDKQNSSGQGLPESRAEILKKQRREKAEKLEPPHQNIIEKYALKFDRKGNQSVEDLNFWGFHPRLDWISTASGPALGVRYWNPEVVGPVDIMGSAFYSLVGYQLYDLQVGLIPNRGKRIPPRTFQIERLEDIGYVKQDVYNRFKLYVSGRFRDLTDEWFFGRGPDSKESNVAYYGVRDTLLEVVTGYQITRRISFTFKAGVLQNSLGKGTSSPSIGDRFPLPPIPPDTELPGRTAPPNYARYGTSVLFDFRDNPGLPHKGFMIAFGWEKYDNINAPNLFNFNRFEFDGHTFIPLGSRQRVLAFRVRGVDSDPAPGNAVPFFLQPYLGGGESLRGFDPFRFQADKTILLQGEYRWEASRWMEFAAFMDTGTVANQGARLSINKMKTDAGAGFRFNSSRSTLLRFDVAQSNEGLHFILRFSAVF